jgi:Flp pilus assembly protein TadG
MKTQITNIALAFLTTITLFSCTPNEDELKTKAPVNVAPINGKSFSADEALQPITFRWTPVVPKPQSVTYRLKVWQLMQGQSGTQAMRSNLPIVTKDVDNITETTVVGIYNGPCKPPYLCDFVWAVQAISADGTTVGENDGTSNITLFNF